MNIISIKNCISSTFHVNWTKYLDNGNFFTIKDFDISLSEKNLAKEICYTINQLIKAVYFKDIAMWSYSKNRATFSFDNSEIIFTAKDDSFNFESIYDSMNIEFANIKYCQV